MEDTRLSAHGSPTGIAMPSPEELSSELEILVPDEDVGADRQAESEEQLTATGNYGRSAQSNLYKAITKTANVFSICCTGGYSCDWTDSRMSLHFSAELDMASRRSNREDQSFLTGGIITGSAMFAREYLNPRS